MVPFADNTDPYAEVPLYENVACVAAVPPLLLTCNRLEGVLVPIPT